MNFLTKLKIFLQSGSIPPDYARILEDFFQSYQKAVLANTGKDASDCPLLATYLDLIADQIQNPHPFPLFHQRILAPFDYYRFGLDFLRPIIRFPESTLLGEAHLKEIDARLKRGENVILLANHQTEPDPQAISLLLEHTYSDLAQNMIFIAGHRVLQDPMAVPFSKGRNLLCIYSKNYVEHPPEQKAGKLLHNQKTMRKMRDLLAEGGKCIYVAPSGGRDRKNADGKIEVAPFDPQSIEMLWLTAELSAAPTHFHPLALRTYAIAPPPDTINIGIGERRWTQSAPIHLHFGPSIDMIRFPGSEKGIEDKKEARVIRAHYIWSLVHTLYTQIEPG